MYLAHEYSISGMGSIAMSSHRNFRKARFHKLTPLHQSIDMNFYNFDDIVISIHKYYLIGLSTRTKDTN